MNNLPNIGKYLFIIPMAVFGLFHMSAASQMAGAIPSWLPGGEIWVYLTGVCLFLVVIAFFIKKKAKLALTLLGFMILGFALLVQLRSFIGGDEMAMGQVMKDLAIAGGAFMLSGMVKD